MCQIEDIVEGYKRAIDEIRGAIAKKLIFGPKSGPVARKRPTEGPYGPFLGPRGPGVNSVQIEPYSKRKWPKTFFWGYFYYLINGIAWYCIVLYCVVGFGAQAVSRKTPIYFKILWTQTI